jgi:hypothetical protein
VVTLAAFTPPDVDTVDPRTLRDEIRTVPFLSVSGAVAINWWVVIVDRDGAVVARHMGVAIGCDGSKLRSGGGLLRCDRPTRPSSE